MRSLIEVDSNSIVDIVIMISYGHESETMYPLPLGDPEGDVFIESRNYDYSSSLNGNLTLAL